MALKKSDTTRQQPHMQDNQDHRHDQRDYAGLIRQLLDTDANKRRWAARDLAQFPDAVKILLDSLSTESEHMVREAIFDSLQQLAKQDKGEYIVSGLITLLRSEDAELRNGAIEILQSMPEYVATRIIELLNDQDSDVRIFAIDILQQLAHPQTPQWLLSVLKDETHVNVIATAIDRLAEVGTPEMIDDLLAIKQRFANEPFLGFAVDTAIRRIEGK